MQIITINLFQSWLKLSPPGNCFPSNNWASRSLPPPLLVHYYAVTAFVHSSAPGSLSLYCNLFGGKDCALAPFEYLSTIHSTVLAKSTLTMFNELTKLELL